MCGVREIAGAQHNIIFRRTSGGQLEERFIQELWGLHYGHSGYLSLFHYIRILSKIPKVLYSLCNDYFWDYIDIYDM